MEPEGAVLSPTPGERPAFQSSSQGKCETFAKGRRSLGEAGNMMKNDYRIQFCIVLPIP